MLATVRLMALVVLVPSFAFGQYEMPVWRASGWCSYKPSAGRPLPPRLNLPDWVCETTHKRGLQRIYVPYTGMNPFFLSGDFDADGKSDIAIWVTSRKDRKRGILIVTNGSNRHFVAGAGRDPKEPADDYTFVDVWSLIPKGEVLESNHEDNKVSLRGDAIYAGMAESAAFAIYWDGQGFKFYQLSD